MDSTITQNVADRKYGRDYLLQLRMHPCSLQKPNNLTNHEIVKDKLYLHQLNFAIESQNGISPCAYSEDIHMPLKPDHETMFRYHHSLPDCFSRNCALFGAGRKCNALTSSKNRQLYIPDYVNPLRKLQFHTSLDCEYDLSCDGVYCSNVPLSKQCGSFSDELWNCQSHQSEKDASSKTSFEGLSRSKKKPLPIIDPKNGKNILDGICKTSTTYQESIISEETDQDIETKRESLITRMSELSVQDEECNFVEMNNDKEKIVHNVVSDDDFSCSSQPLEDETQNMVDNNKNSKDVFKDSSESSNYSSQFTSGRNKTLPIHDNGLNFEDQLKMNIKLLREKIYSVKQEQQKLAILQSFLRFKKHQLDESYRRMDDKKIEIANWECNLATKAKRLQEKECWLESRRLSLLSKESKLNERENILNETQNEIETKSKWNENDEEIEEKTAENRINGTMDEYSINYELGDSLSIQEPEISEEIADKNSELEEAL
ncbi:uncharacterized protein NPIL_435541 [Nephila pilipes]|uniref:Uncharacterized protein n=1 Tax=Nephila pilipes TaxID=299642 RepID=A0A8X6N5T8_NEPPI|nr:uncharacterized protein NPIL_435541 [Nephila pilipes]